MASRQDKKPYSRPAARPRASDGAWVHDRAIGFKGTDKPARNVSTVPASKARTKLEVTNLHYELTPKDLASIFGQCGTLVREPYIRYDPSGRSTGVAIISYETPEEAEQAKIEFDGKLAKGQAMMIEFHAGPPARPQGQPRRVASEPSLLNRIQKPPLLDRLGGETPSAPKRNAAPVPKGPARGPGPIRTKARPVKEKKKPKTAAELDSELDAFMKDDVEMAT
ncbi:hypothetical protein BXZ70DRAFT_110796 [Cristinia sonorae]|uniref:RRM domain-containing protein n=1 Tax=Cristinia sonorae TaxID=1940300 RepID=A0A8K0XQE5_9AGAR|nr:hypothetical protein BXZ70DRAFT_110796 [Cristinia sonorae]